MRKADDVFFFTLIDFLVQVFFFGLVVYAFAQDKISEEVSKQKNEHAEVEAIKKATGISNLTQLRDDLSKLAPIQELKGFSDYLKQNGNFEKLKTDNKFIYDNGGVEKIKFNLEKLKKIEEGSGKPPCIFSEINGKKTPIILATVFANDTHIKFKENTEELKKVLSKIGLDFSDVENQTFEQFKKNFKSVPELYPDCRFTLNFMESTNLIFARDSARTIFYLRYGKI